MHRQLIVSVLQFDKIYGEGSQVYGHIYQISNQLTLGKTEDEIIDNLTEVVQQIINEEMQIRERLTNNTMN